MLIRAGLPVVSFVSFLSLFFLLRCQNGDGDDLVMSITSQQTPQMKHLWKGWSCWLQIFVGKEKVLPAGCCGRHAGCCLARGFRKLLFSKKQKEKKIISSFLSSSRRVRHFQQSGIDLAVAKATRRIIDPVLLLLILKTRLLARHVTDPLRFNGGERQKSRSQDRITSRKRKTYCIYFLI